MTKPSSFFRGKSKVAAVVQSFCDRMVFNYSSARLSISRRLSINENLDPRLLTFLFFYSLMTMPFGFLNNVYAGSVAVDRPARIAQCLLEVNGVHYVGGDCLFAPLDRAGSFQITTDKRYVVVVKVKSPGRADIAWNGPDRREGADQTLGSAFSNEKGCWITFSSSPVPLEGTLICAWDKNLRLFLGPTSPNSPSPALAWGERWGMSAQIISSSGLGTENATVTAIKDGNGAINWCRVNYDYSAACIDNTLKDTRESPRKVMLRANCKSKRFTDFWGRNLEASGEDFLDLSTMDKIDGSAASGSTVASTAFETLCPKEEK